MEPGSSTVFKAMLEREIHPDITIKAKGGSARAHRCVLACISPVFEAMFRNQMEEQRTSVLKMPDMSIEALNLFLKAIYCGFGGIDIDSLVQKWKEVFAACHKYDVPFQDGGTAFMEKTLSVDNCWEYLDMALLWTPVKNADNTGMVSVCYSYMYANCLEITEADNFYDATIKYPRLVVRFTKYVIRELLDEYA